MKLLISILLAIALPAIGYDLTDIAPAPLQGGNSLLPGQAVASGVINATDTSAVGVEVSLIGRPYTSALLTITNVPATNLTEKVGVNIAGTWTTFTWANNDGLSTVVPGGYSTTATITVTNGDDGTAQTVLSVITTGPTTNAYTINTNSAAYSRITGSANGRVLATNIYTRLSADFPSFTWSMPATNSIRAVTLTNDNLSMEVAAETGAFATSVASTTSTTVATNLHYIVAAAHTGSSATNLYTALVRDLPLVTVAYSASNALVIASANGQALDVTNQVHVGTMEVTTNAPYGAVIGLSSNSLDGVTWSRFVPGDWSILMTSAIQTSLCTNVPMGSYGYLKYGISSTGTNGAAGNFQMRSSVKRGF